MGNIFSRICLRSLFSSLEVSEIRPISAKSYISIPSSSSAPALLDSGSALFGLEGVGAQALHVVVVVYG